MINKKQEERLDYLLEEFKKDSVWYKDLEVGRNYQEKRRALRSLMNIRMPGAMDSEVLKVQDDFLREEAVEKGIVTLEEIPTAAKQYGSHRPFRDKISIWQGDITRLQVGAIVNAANSQMLGCFHPCHGCIDNAIHSAAGIELREECSRYMDRRRARYGKDYEEPTGQPVLTEGYNLPAEHVIHTVGPIVYRNLTEALKEDLRNCYKNVLKCCVEHGIRSVAFCCISTGEFHFPNDEAARIAVAEVEKFLEKHERDFDRILLMYLKMQTENYMRNLCKSKSNKGVVSLIKSDQWAAPFSVGKIPYLEKSGTGSENILRFLLTEEVRMDIMCLPNNHT